MFHMTSGRSVWSSRSYPSAGQLLGPPRRASSSARRGPLGLAVQDVSGTIKMIKDFWKDCACYHILSMIAVVPL